MRFSVWINQPARRAVAGHNRDSATRCIWRCLSTAAGPNPTRERASKPPLAIRSLSTNGFSVPTAVISPQATSVATTAASSRAVKVRFSSPRTDATRPPTRARRKATSPIVPPKAIMPLSRGRPPMSVVNSSTQFSKRHCAGRRVDGQATISALDLKEPRKARMKGVNSISPMTHSTM